MSPKNQNDSGFPQHLKLALKYAEESSRRGRWIVFILQLAVVLVMAAVWQSNERNWAQQRLTVAQNAVRLLTCQPEQVYLPSDPTLQAAVSTVSAIPGTQKWLDADCISLASMTKAEQDQVRTFLKDWSFSLEEARKYEDDMQHFMATRVLGVSVPILGIVFDINDLSVVAAITFSIMLSWLHFALQGQRKNVKRVFAIAKQTGGLDSLGLAYDVLAMGQVLTITPGDDIDTRDISRVRIWSRLPNLIIWTAVLAQAIVIMDDLHSMPRGQNLQALVNNAETAIAIYLFGYILYRTIKCSALMMDTYCEWVDAFNELNPQSPIRMEKGSKCTAWLNDSRIGIAWCALAVASLLHILDEARGHISPIVDLGHLVGVALLLTTIVIGVMHFSRQKLRNTYITALSLPVFACLDVVIHNVRAIYHTESLSYTQLLGGFYSSPILIVTSMVLLTQLRRKRLEAGEHSRPPTQLGAEASTAG